MSSKLLDAALEYTEMGFSIIPVNTNKQSLIKWEKYQKEKASPEQIRKWWDKWPDANIGIVTGSISNLAVIDIDTEDGRQEIQKYIGDAIFPIANTPSGGQHLLFQCSDNNISNRTNIPPGCDLRANKGYIVAVPSVNGNGKGYTWQERFSIHDVPLQPLPQSYLSLINNYIYSKSSSNAGSSNFLSQGRRDEDLFHVANCLIKGGMNERAALQVIEILAKNCSPPFPEKEIQAKIKSALNRSERRQSTIAQDVRDFVMASDGVFKASDVNNGLQMASKQDRRNVTQILRRMYKEGVLEKYGNQDGCYRRIDDSAEDIDFINADTNAINIKLPFDIHHLVNIYPKNVIVIAGSPNSGKTAFLLNVAEMNMFHHNVIYFSSEMAEQELKIRLSKFDRELTSWKCKFKERSSNFSDVIKPDAMNIVDFLEIHDEFWKVGAMIKAIYDKLKKGIAIVAIQKNRDKDTGRGGELSLEKPRLYLSMNQNQLKIEKAKIWANHENNPNGLILDFKLIQGCKFIETNEWYK